MARYNLLTALPPPPPVPQTRTFSDPQQPGQEITVTLRALHPNEKYAAEDDALKWQREKTAIKPPAGGTVALSFALFRMIATLSRAEVAPEGEAKYTPLQWATLAEYAPEAFADMVLWHGETLQPEYDQLLRTPRALPTPEGDAPDA